MPNMPNIPNIHKYDLSIEELEMSSTYRQDWSEGDVVECKDGNFIVDDNGDLRSQCDYDKYVEDSKPINQYVEDSYDI